MLKIFPALALAAACLAVPAFATEGLDAETETMLRCGAGYMLIADDESIAETAEDKEMFTNYGTLLMTLGDQALIEAGMSEQERADLGYQITAEVDSALENGTDAGFEPEECLALLDKKEAEISPEENARNEKIDMLMTCGAGFIVSAESLKEQGEESDAALLEQLGTNQVDAAEDLMIEAGMGQEARFQVSQMYGEQVATKMQAGEELDYDWDTCAALEY